MSADRGGRRRAASLGRGGALPGEHARTVLRRRRRLRLRLQGPRRPNLAFVCECADHADIADQPDGRRRIVHVNLNARDFEASLAFFTATLGFRLVDENAPLSFLHCANADHCSIVLARTNLATLNHNRRSICPSLIPSCVAWGA